jgi:hypothetical protein
MTNFAATTPFLSLQDGGPTKGGSHDLSLSAALGTLAALFLAMPQGVAAAEPVSPLAQGLLGVPDHDDTPPAQHFTTPNGAVRFTLDRSGQTALVRFDGHSEVLALTPTPGPRGDEYLKNDTGEVVLRVSAMGSVTVYGPANVTGAPASVAGRATPLAMPGLPAGGLSAKLSEVERNANKALGHPVSFETPAGPSLNSAAAVGLVADAADRIVEGLAAAHAAGVERVIIQFGPRPQAQLERDSLEVTITPQLGYAGRPSAEAVRNALRGSMR